MLIEKNSITYKYEFNEISSIKYKIEIYLDKYISISDNDDKVVMSFSEFDNFKKNINSAFNEKGELFSFKFKSFDLHFLFSMSDLLPFISSIKIEETRLSYLKCITYSNFEGRFNYIKITPIIKTHAFKFLNKKSNEFLNYKQGGHSNLSNEERIIKSLNSIKNNAYPFNNQFIVLFGDQNIIRDGQHRAAILMHLFGLEHKIKVMHIKFNNSSYRVNSYKHNLKTLLKGLIGKQSPIKFENN
jgi:hypothetical protein